MPPSLPPPPLSPPQRQSIPLPDPWPLHHEELDSRLPPPVNVNHGDYAHSSSRPVFPASRDWVPIDHPDATTYRADGMADVTRAGYDRIALKRQVDMLHPASIGLHRSLETDNDGCGWGIQHQYQQRQQQQQKNSSAAREMEGLMKQMRDVKISEPPLPQMRKAEEEEEDDSQRECEKALAAAVKLNAQAKANGVAVDATSRAVGAIAAAVTATAAAAAAQAGGVNEKEKEVEWKKKLEMEMESKREKLWDLARVGPREEEMERKNEIVKHEMEKLVKKLKEEMKGVKEKRIEEKRTRKRGGDDLGVKTGLRVECQVVDNAAAMTVLDRKGSSTTGVVAPCSSNRTVTREVTDDNEGVLDEEDEWLEVAQPCKENTGEWWNLEEQCQEVKSAGIKREKEEEEDGDDEGWEIA